MKLLLQRLAKFLQKIAAVVEAYRDLFLAWLNDLAARAFPTPAKVHVLRQQPTRSRTAKTRR